MRARKGEDMDASNPTTPEMQRKPLSVKAQIFCTVVFFACQVALPALLYYIGRIDPQTGVGTNVPSAIALGTLALCIAFVLTLCKKPLFLSCCVLGLFASFLVSPWFCALFAALLCATVAGAATLADAKGARYLPFAVTAPVAFGLSLLLTKSLLLCLISLLPALAALALAVCFKHKISVIVSVGTVTGTLTASVLLLILAELLAAGMPFSVQGLTDAVKEFHAALSSMFAQALQMMAETEELALSVEQMLGGKLDAQTIAEFSDSVSYAVLGLLPGSTVMLLWLFSFAAHRGFTAILISGQPQKVCPAHLSQYAPSIPTAVLLLLCFATLLITSMIPRAETVTFVALNVLLVLMPLLAVSGIAGIVANVKRAPVKWPLILTYVIAFMFLGLAIVPMLSFFGAFGVILQAISKALEEKMKDFRGE